VLPNVKRRGFRAGKALPLILAAAVVVSGAVGAGAGIFLAPRVLASSQKGAKKKREEPGIIYSLGEMVVNLADTDTLRYAKITVALGFEEKVPEDKLKEVTPVLRDVIITVLSRKHFSDLHRPEGPEKVKQEIRLAMQERVSKMTVSEVYLDSLAMQ
jgi:flagellar FliL protein